MIQDVYVDAHRALRRWQPEARFSTTRWRLQGDTTTKPSETRSIIATAWLRPSRIRAPDQRLGGLHPVPYLRGAKAANQARR